MKYLWLLVFLFLQCTLSLFDFFFTSMLFFLLWFLHLISCPLCFLTVQYFVNPLAFGFFIVSSVDTLYRWSLLLLFIWFFWFDSSWNPLHISSLRFPAISFLFKYKFFLFSALFKLLFVVHLSSLLISFIWSYYFLFFGLTFPCTYACVSFLRSLSSS